MDQSSLYAATQRSEAMQFHEYARLKDSALAQIELIRPLGRLKDSALSDLEARLKSDIFHLLVVGQFKRGKTCLLNALLGSDLLPMAVIPLTSMVTVLTYGEELKVEVKYLDGRVESVHRERLGDFVTESGNPRNVKRVREVLITYPSPYLKDGVRLIDTPGVGSVYRHNTDVAYQYLPRADAALFLLSVEQPASQAELDFLKDVRQFSGKLFFLLNKIDYLSEPEVLESLDFAAGVLREALDAEVRVYPVSAKKALEAKLEKSDEKLAASRLPEFTEVLEGFLTHEKGKALLLSATGHLMRITSQMRLEKELELKSAAMPLEELNARIAVFEAKKREMIQQKERLDILLEGEIQKIIAEGLDPRLKAFKDQFLSEMDGRFDAFYEEKREFDLKALDASLSDFVVQEVEQAFRQWVAQLEEHLTHLLEKACEELALRVTEIVESLQAFSSDLFDIEYHGAAGTRQWKGRYSLTFRLQEEPVGLEMLITSLTQVVPGLVMQRFQKLRETLFRWARKRIFDSRKAKMLRTIDMQSGQVRHHFLDRLQRAKQAFGREMMVQIDVAMDGIVGAVERGLEKRAMSEKEVAERQAVLVEEIEKLGGIQGELHRIRGRVAV
ncbi:MAG: dynamin family protein [Syntrophobacteraceae bacterium]|nr:dynamin family protein [Syntrophobacteraceae bacterium]